MQQYKAYLTESNLENTRFQFQSIGKRGVFEKVIFFTPLTFDTFNLSLVDYDTATGNYNDLSVTDNGGHAGSSCYSYFHYPPISWF
jgi:hypothetical protein